MHGIFVKKGDVFYFACMALLKITKLNFGDEYELHSKKNAPSCVDLSVCNNKKR
ncbi:hypothetical protein HDC90_002556 [Pedobacter sp. AK013]|nr:hypothetical protein [Pedobacter sp. AK013]